MVTSIVLHVFLFLCHSGTDDETLLNQNEAVQETVEINVSNTAGLYIYCKVKNYVNVKSSPKKNPKTCMLYNFPRGITVPIYELRNSAIVDDSYTFRAGRWQPKTITIMFFAGI